MAITFLEKRKKLKYLFPVLFVIILISFFIFWRGFFRERKPTLLPVPEKPAKIIEIDFSDLKNPLLKELQPFPEVKPIEGKVGRENPFIPPF